MPPSPSFELYVFGPARLCVDGAALSLPPQPAVLSAFLVLNRQRRITREEVQTAFWPDAEPAKAQERLRRTLYLLRQTVSPFADLVAAEGTELAIAPDVRLWVDYDAFESALLDAYRTDPPHRQSLQAAIDLYHDDLLKDVYADWVLLEREHARQRFLTALRQLVSLCLTDADWSAAIEYAHRLLELDPFQEIAYRALMTAYAATGDRSAALRQYQQCAQLLREELDTDPLPETIQLYEDIRQGRGVQVFPAVTAAAPAPRTPSDLQSVPLVGRDRELAEIAAEWQVCRSGNSRLVLLTGPAGMGKTRLVDEAVARIPGRGVTVISGNCYAMEAGTPYQLISEWMLRAAERVMPRLSVATRVDLAQLVPAFQPQAAPVIAVGSASLPDVAVRLQEAVTQVIRLLAAQDNGLWLVAEDLHWADPASLACLNHALRRCRDLPLMVLATLRDEEVSFDSPLMDWPTSSVHAPAPTTLIQLPPLLPDQLRHLLGGLLGDDANRLTDWLHQETAGNPLFVVETLRAMIEQGALVTESEGIWRLRGPVMAQQADLPMSDVVLRVLRGRIRRLSRPAQDVLTAAAVIEHNIEERLLAQLVDPAMAFDLVLDELLTAYVLEESAPGVYQFAHIKVREVIYADTSTPRRRFYHRRVAELLAQRSASDRLADMSKLAYHYTQARVWTPALLHGWRAAQTAMKAGALAEANRYAEQAQRILDEHEDELNSAEFPVPLAAIRFDVLALRAEFRRQAATAGLYYPPDLMAEIESLLPDIDESRRAQAALQKAIHLSGQGDLSGAREAADSSRALYVALGDRWGEFRAIQHQIDVAYRAGDMVAIRRLSDDLRAVSASVERAEVDQALAYTEMRLAVYEADWLSVLSKAEKLSSPKRPYDPVLAWSALTNLGLAYLKLGAYDRAYGVAQQAVEASEDAGVLGLGARVLLARLEFQRGQLDAARTLLLDLLETPDPLMGESEVVAPALALVRCCAAAGDEPGATRWARRAGQAVSRVRLPILFPLSQIARALAHIAGGRYAEASKCLRSPLEWVLLLEDTSPQEIFALRAIAARGTGDEVAAEDWRQRAAAAVQQQAACIDDAQFRETFLNDVPLHRFIRNMQTITPWTLREMTVIPDSHH